MSQLELKRKAILCAQKIRTANLEKQPFNHLVIDDFLDKKLAINAMNSFPSLNDDCWNHSTDLGIEVKSRTNWKSEFDIPENIIDVIRISNSSLILKAISEILRIPKLMPDPYFSGGGLNVSERGGHLDVHIDGNYHDASGLNRRVNLIIYFNPKWEKSWGGEFGIYSDDGSKLIKAIPPKFNRCIIFDSHDKSFHGLPNPIKFPKDDPRKSIILYYYTLAKRPQYQTLINQPHSALWKSKGLVDKKGNRTREFT